MPDIPVEIWNCILEYIPDGDVRSLYSVNRAFFYKAMQIKWQRITLPTTGFSEEVLERIKDPFVASHVHELRIVIHFDNLELPSGDARKRRNPIDTLVKGLASSIDTRILTRLKSPKVPGPTGVFNVLPGIKFENLQHLYFTSSAATWPQSSLPHLRAILPSLAANINSSALNRLSLHLSLSELRIVLSDKPEFPLLQYLGLEIKKPDSPSSIHTENVISEYLAPFINAMCGNLQSLGLKSYYSFDLSTFLNGLAVLPCLRILDIGQACRGETVYPALFSELCSQKFPRLTSLHLPIILGQRFHTDPLLQGELYQWLRACLIDGRCVTGLSVLDIYPTTISTSLDVVLAAIRSNMQTLQQIRIRGRFFGPEETAQLLDGLAQCPNLTGLRMNVEVLDIAVFTKLTSTIATLESLILGINTVSPSLYVDMQDYHCPSSKLKHFTTRPFPDMINVFSQDDIRRCIPSIRTVGKLQDLIDSV